ncbi:60S ribosomal protein L18a-like protein [Ipomoea triloba]|uniref:60S ribosomal protein L18a-like protein n=1 Tax=Ipomoea triloba TaxID=35885 RepID=UPI00125E302A|nr:60S ribosomal protein L18a-like protein [Ipomoea triloba]
MGNKESSHRRHARDDGDRERQPLLGGAPDDRRPLPCCGCGTGWCMFISGFFLVAVPWYIAAFILICGKVGRREKPGYIASTIAAVGATGALIYGLYRLLPHLIPLIMALFGI